MPRRDAGIPAVRDDLFRGWLRPAKPAARDKELGDAGDSESRVLGMGDPDSEPALKGWKDTEGRRTPLPKPRIWGLATVTGSELGGLGSTFRGIEFGGELVSDPGGRTALRAVIGLVASAFSPWKVDRLPYVCWTSPMPRFRR
jgi:hypothetical protein